MKVLVCGSRDWNSKDERVFLYRFLSRFHKVHVISCVIEGEAKGADTMAREWAEHSGISVEKYPADWDTYKRAAGPIRNKQMIDEGKPDVVIGFHQDLESSKGTKNMQTQSLKAKLVFIDAVKADALIQSQIDEMFRALLD